MVVSQQKKNKHHLPLMQLRGSYSHQGIHSHKTLSITETLSERFSDVFMCI